MAEVTEIESIFTPPSRRNHVKAQCLTALSMYTAIGKPWTTASDLRSALGMPHSLLTLLSRWISYGYIERRGDSGYYSYRLARKGKVWLKDLPLWWPEHRRGVPLEESQRLLAVDSVKRHVAEASGIVVWWGQYAGGIAWNIRAIRGPFLGTDDYLTHNGRVAIGELRHLFNSDYLVEASDAMTAISIVSDKLGLPSGRPMIQALVDAGLLAWE